jgi:hypothetical protein
VEVKKNTKVGKHSFNHDFYSKQKLIKKLVIIKLDGGKYKKQENRVKEAV